MTLYFFKCCLAQEGECTDYVCDGYSMEDEPTEWQNCVNNNELYNPNKFGTHSFCKYCLTQEDGVGDCYCADSEECYKFWYGGGIAMMVIGLITVLVVCKKINDKNSGCWTNGIGLFGCALIIGGIVLVSLAATDSGY